MNLCDLLLRDYFRSNPELNAFDVKSLSLSMANFRPSQNIQGGIEYDITFNHELLPRPVRRVQKKVAKKAAAKATKKAKK